MLLPAFFLWAFWGGLTVREYTLCSSKIPKGKSVCIVHLSDLHSAMFGENQKDLVKVIRNAKPDFIAMTGDMADDKEPITGAVRLLSATVEIAPVFYVSGNHEFWSGRIGEIRSLFKAHGAIVLENAYQEIVTANGVSLIIGGMDDPETSCYEKFGLNWSETLRELSPPMGTPRIFPSCSPIGPSPLRITGAPPLIWFYPATPTAGKFAFLRF